MAYKDLKIQKFLNCFSNNRNLKKFSTNFDNTKAPIHRWFPFLTGFSNNLVKETINYFNIDENELVIFDPFMGSGTTGVVGKELGIYTLGNESNKFLHRICKLKTNLHVNPDSVKLSAEELLNNVRNKWKKVDIENENKLLVKCYPINNLKKLISLRDKLTENSEIPKTHKELIFMAITMTLPRSSNVGINIPYVSWSHKRKPKDTFLLLKNNINIINEDLTKSSSKYKSNAKVKVYLHDTRKENNKIKNESIDIVFTSPPYLNNFDYGEALKVFLYFWNISYDWSEITDKIRKHGISSSTTYYSESKYIGKDYEELFNINLMERIPNTSQEVIEKAKQISLQKDKKSARKSFDILTIMYFKDMCLSLSEIFRVMKKNALAFIIIGDSAPYGVHVPTDSLLGEIALELGFSCYTLYPLRIRGVKWKTLKYRHNKKLRESLLILRK